MDNQSTDRKSIKNIFRRKNNVWENTDNQFMLNPNGNDTRQYKFKLLFCCCIFKKKRNNDDIFAPVDFNPQDIHVSNKKSNIYYPNLNFNDNYIVL